MVDDGDTRDTSDAKGTKQAVNCGRGGIASDGGDTKEAAGVKDEGNAGDGTDTNEIIYGI